MMRLYRGVKRRQFEKLAKKHGCHLDDRMLAVQVGSVLNDCDGFNHIVTRIEYIKTRTRKGWYLSDMEAYREDGTCFCLCRNFPCDASSSKMITEYFSHYASDDGLEYIEGQEAKGWNYTWARVIRALLLKGEPICTDWGTAIPQSGVSLERLYPPKR